MSLLPRPAPGGQDRREEPAGERLHPSASLLRCAPVPPASEPPVAARHEGLGACPPPGVPEMRTPTRIAPDRPRVHRRLRWDEETYGSHVPALQSGEVTMGTTTKPLIRELDRAECEAILARNHVGRLAYARGNHIDIEPLHYVYSDGWIYGRTSEGRKIETTGYTWWPIVFEVDEVEALFRWRSVVVHGGFYSLPGKGMDWQVEEWQRGVELLRTLIPETFTDDDPVAFRTILFRISVQEISGRSAIPEGEDDGGGVP